MFQEIIQGKTILLGFTQTEQILDIWTQESGIFHVFKKHPSKNTP